MGWVKHLLAFQTLERKEEERGEEVEREGRRGREREEEGRRGKKREGEGGRGREREGEGRREKKRKKKAGRKGGRKAGRKMRTIEGRKEGGENYITVKHLCSSISPPALYVLAIT